MSEPLTVTRTPIQITDGTNSGHVTVAEGFIEYADSADSIDWHQGRSRSKCIRAMGSLAARCIWHGG